MFCILMLCQNIVWPFVATMSVIDKSAPAKSTHEHWNGALLGGFLGMVGAASHVLADNVHFFFFGGRDAFIASSGVVASPIDIQFVVMSVTLNAAVWLALVMISAVAGLIGSLSNRKQR